MLEWSMMASHSQLHDREAFYWVSCSFPRWQNQS